MLNGVIECLTNAEPKEFKNKDGTVEVITWTMSTLTDKQLDDLQWAKEFMERYERNRKS